MCDHLSVTVRRNAKWWQKRCSLNPANCTLPKHRLAEAALGERLNGAVLPNPAIQRIRFVAVGRVSNKSDQRDPDTQFGAMLSGASDTKSGGLVVQNRWSLFRFSAVMPILRMKIISGPASQASAGSESLAGLLMSPLSEGTWACAFAALAAAAALSLLRRPSPWLLSFPVHRSPINIIDQSHRLGRALTEGGLGVLPALYSLNLNAVIIAPAQPKPPFHSLAEFVVGLEAGRYQLYLHSLGDYRFSAIRHSDYAPIRRIRETLRRRPIRLLPKERDVFVRLTQEKGAVTLGRTFGFHKVWAESRDDRLLGGFHFVDAQLPLPLGGQPISRRMGQPCQDLLSEDLARASEFALVHKLRAHEKARRSYSLSQAAASRRSGALQGLIDFHTLRPAAALYALALLGTAAVFGGECLFGQTLFAVFARRLLV